MATTISKIMFFNLLSILIVCASVQGAIFQTFRRELMIQTIQRLVTTPLGTSSPALLTVPVNAPVPTPSPGNTPAPAPSPVNTPAPAPSPVRRGQPVTTTPAPVGSVPAAAPSPSTTNAPAGEVWCVANSGARRVTLQNALDFACGHGADCSAIQPGAVCYDPNTLQDHASYAFNSYYHNSPLQSSCDFEGLARITTVNPSYGSCIYPSTRPTPATPNPTPTPTVMSPPPTPTVPGDPGSGGGGTTGIADSPQSVSTSMATGLQPFISWWIILGTSIITERIVTTIM